MDLVYSLGTGSNWENNEIRYSLRSAEKFLSVDKVYIVGEPVCFLHNYNHIPLKEDSVSSHVKQLNIYRKVLTACQHPGISKEFIYMADDHFWLQPIQKVPYWYSGKLINSWKSVVNTSYQHSLMNTYNELLKKGLPTRNFNCHTPIIYNKELFLKTVTGFRWGMYHGYAIKSLYCNCLGIEGEPYDELKIKNGYTLNELKEITAGRVLFSINDESLNQSMKDFLQELYPEKSKWEK